MYTWPFSSLLPQHRTMEASRSSSPLLSTDGSGHFSLSKSPVCPRPYSSVFALWVVRHNVAQRMKISKKILRSSSRKCGHQSPEFGRVFAPFTNLGVSTVLVHVYVTGILAFCVAQSNSFQSFACRLSNCPLLCE